MISILIYIYVFFAIRNDLRQETEALKPLDTKTVRNVRFYTTKDDGVYLSKETKDGWTEPNPILGLQTEDYVVISNLSKENIFGMETKELGNMNTVETIDISNPNPILIIKDESELNPQMARKLADSKPKTNAAIKINPGLFSNIITLICLLLV